MYHQPTSSLSTSVNYTSSQRSSSFVFIYNPPAMAFVASLPLTAAHSSPLSLARPQTSYLFARKARFSSQWTMVSPPEPTSTSTSASAPTTSSSSTNEVPGDNPIDVDVLVTRAKDVLEDVTDRPGYYSKIAAYLAGAIVLTTILRSIVVAIDSLPVLPATLELIGLGYSAWFVWRYVLFRESRAELLEEIDDFLGRTRPGGKQ